VHFAKLKIPVYSINEDMQLCYSDLVHHQFDWYVTNSSVIKQGFNTKAKRCKTVLWWPCKYNWMKASDCDGKANASAYLSAYHHSEQLSSTSVP